jgi:hypothetical protein
VTSIILCHVRAHLFDRPHALVGHRAVNEHVDAAVLAFDQVEHVLHGRAIGEISLRRDSFPAHVLDRFGHHFGGFHARSIVHHHARIFARKIDRHLAAQSAAGARNQHHLAGQFQISAHLRSQMRVLYGGSRK